nr:MAG TPA: hypothetical protein [Caudoviricetes sp.]
MVLFLGPSAQHYLKFIAVSSLTENKKTRFSISWIRF